MAVGGAFRKTVWDPILILSQIGSLQCCYYASLGFWLFLFHYLGSVPRSLDLLFQYQSLALGLPTGKLILAAYFCNALTCSFCVWFLVERAKLCLDFTCTTHFFHFIFSWMYNSSLPYTLSWWVIHGVCLTVMCVSAEFLCMRSELRAIPVSLMGSHSASKADL